MTDELVTSKSHITVGMFRPPWEEVNKADHSISCSCGTTISIQQELREHWQQGHFDIPVYESVLAHYYQDKRKHVC